MDAKRVKFKIGDKTMAYANSYDIVRQSGGKEKLIQPLEELMNSTPVLWESLQERQYWEEFYNEMLIEQPSFAVLLTQKDEWKSVIKTIFKIVDKYFEHKKQEVDKHE